MDTGYIENRGVREKVSCEVAFFDFSAHAGHSELVDFIRRCDPENVVLMHSDSREELAAEFEGERKVLLPEAGEKVEL
jgi:putative mRNA 3-end processing factor